jgi:hypothetical protein
MSCSLKEPGASAGVASGVPADFHVILELLASDRPPFGQQRLDLLENKSVALNGRRVVGFLIPDLPPDVRCLRWTGETAHALPQLSDLHVKAFVDGLTRGSPTRAHVTPKC